MSDGSEFRYLLEEIRVFYRNINKDNSARRKDIKVINRKLRKLDKLRSDFSKLRDICNKSKLDIKVKDEIKGFADAISKYLEASNKILDDRKVLSREEQPETVNQNLNSINNSCGSSSDSSDSDCSNDDKMAENFELKTAATLLPVMNGNENVTKQLIDAIELYDSMLNQTGKKLLTTYILKTRLSQNAKIRLSKTYESNADLIIDLRNHFITKKSAPALSSKLNNAKQGNKTIDEFGSLIEDLFVNLTITQSEGKEDAVQILNGVNEKLAINAFANGLRNSDLRTVVKARNYSKLSDAIQGAKDEELPTQGNQIFYTHTNNQLRRSSNNNRFFRGNTHSNTSTSQNKGNNYKFNRSQNNYSYNRGNSNSYRNNSNSYRNTNFNRGNFRNVGRNNQFRNNNSHLYHFSNLDSSPQSSSNLETLNSQHTSAEKFFRAPMQ